MSGKTLCLFLLAVASLPALAFAQPVADIVIEHNVAMKTRDGVTLQRRRLSARRRRHASPYCSQRTPYNKRTAAEFARKAVARGFMVVDPGCARPLHIRGRVVPLQARDRRRLRHDRVGRGPSAFERQSGHVRRIVRRRYADARGHQPSAPPGRHLPRRHRQSNYHENWTYQGGAFEQWFNESWTAGLAQDTAESR